MILSGAGLGRSVPAADGTRWLFRELDVTAEPGTITAVVGPNGAGKSTLLRTLAGLDTPERGEVKLAGRVVQAMPPRERARAIAYLPQTTPLVHDLTVRELAMLGRTPHRARIGAPTREDVTAVEDALRQVGLQALAGRGVFSLSGGEYQRVMIARMLASRSRVLLLDEPTTSLDVGHGLGVLELLRALAADDRAIVAALHDLELARRFCHRAVCLTGDDGACQVGSATAVLTPEVLGPVFGVRIEERDGVLAFFPSGPADPA